MKIKSLAQLALIHNKSLFYCIFLSEVWDSVSFTVESLWRSVGLTVESLWESVGLTEESLWVIVDLVISRVVRLVVKDFWVVVGLVFVGLVVVDFVVFVTFNDVNTIDGSFTALPIKLNKVSKNKTKIAYILLTKWIVHCK